MKMTKGETFQERKAREKQERVNAALAASQEKYRIAKEQERLVKERLANRSQEEIDAEQARWTANHQIEIETFQKRHSVETEEEAAYREQVRTNLANIADEGE